MPWVVVAHAVRSEQRIASSPKQKGNHQVPNMQKGSASHQNTIFLAFPTLIPVAGNLRNRPLSYNVTSRESQDTNCYWAIPCLVLGHLYPAFW